MMSSWRGRHYTDRWGSYGGSIQAEFSALVGIITKDQDVLLLPGKNWSADLKRRIIYYPADEYLTYEDLGSVVHECGHIKYTPLDKAFQEGLQELTKEHGKYYDEVFHLLNSMEDRRINHLMASELKGAAKYLFYCAEHGYYMHAPMLEDKKMNDPEGFKEFQEKFKAWQYSYTVLMDYSPGVPASWKSHLRSFYHKDAIDALAVSHRDIKNIEGMTWEEMTDLFVKKILPVYFPLCNDVDKDEEKQKEQLKELIEKLLEMMKDAKGRMEKRSEEFEEKGRDGVESEIVNIGEGSEEGDTATILPDMKSSESIREGLEKMFKVSNDGSLSLEELKQNVAKIYPSVRKAVSILKDLDFIRQESGFDSGKIDKRKIHKIYTGYNRIFTRANTLHADDRDMAIALVVDESGSMYGEASVAAAVSVSVVAKALESAGKKFAVYGFNGDFNVHKEFNKKLNIAELLKIHGNANLSAAQWNNDGWAIQESANRLSKRPEKNKIMIVFSDGKPVPKPGFNVDLTKAAHDAERIAKVYSIGIMDDCVKSYYKRYAIINKVEDLSKELIKIFKENTGKRIR